MLAWLPFSLPLAVAHFVRPSWLVVQGLAFGVAGRSLAYPRFAQNNALTTDKSPVITAEKLLCVGFRFLAKAANIIRFGEWDYFRAL